MIIDRSAREEVAIRRSLTEQARGRGLHPGVFGERLGSFCG
jgi:hypothetical protein